jgi:2-methylfumaryl-CoA hydratase
MSKTSSGRFFEDYTLGEVIEHAVPRTVGQGERAAYTMLYPSRHALASSDEFARACGLPTAPMEDLISFHTVFGKTVPDISLNAVANLGYADGRFLAPVYAGDTLAAQSKIIGLKQNSNGKTGIVWVRTTGRNQRGEDVLSYCRWVMVRKRDAQAPAPEPSVPDLPDAVDASMLALPEGLHYRDYDTTLAGEPHRFDDYQIGEHIDHVDGVTLTDAEHMMATRLWQNTSKVHFNVHARPDGARLIYGGHIISMARSLSFNGLANAQTILAINSGAHANPSFAGDTIYAGSTILDKAETSAPSVGALRVRLIAAKEQVTDAQIKDDAGKYLPHIALDLDMWVSVPR